MDLPLGNNDACVTISHLLCTNNPFPLEQTNKQTNKHTHTGLTKDCRYTSCNPITYPIQPESICYYATVFFLLALPKPQKEVPWVVEMTSLVASHFSFSVATYGLCKSAASGFRQRRLLYVICTNICIHSIAGFILQPENSVVPVML